MIQMIKKTQQYVTKSDGALIGSVRYAWKGISGGDIQIEFWIVNQVVILRKNISGQWKISITNLRQEWV